MDFKKLETNDLVIRLFKKSDVQIVYKLSQEPSLGKWMPDQVYKDEGEAAEVIEFLISQYKYPISPDKNPFVLAIVLRQTNEVIGHVGLSPLNDDVEIGYAISEKHCGKGLASQAVIAVSNWALNEISIDKISGVVTCENIGSSRVLEKAGYKLKIEEDRRYLGKIRRCREFMFSNI